MAASGSISIPLDPNRPSASRVYDYLIGGSHNFAVDRAAAQATLDAFPLLPRMLRSARAFVRRSVRFLVEEAGIDQFLDLGAGIPTVGNVHDIVQRANPRARVVYVDIDPTAVVHARSLLRGNRYATSVQADIAEPETVLGEPAVRRVLDFDRPIAVLLTNVLPFVLDDDIAEACVAAYRDAVVPGSYLVIGHPSDHGRDDEIRALNVFGDLTQRVVMRGKAELESYFVGTELVPPGIVLTPCWRPDTDEPAQRDDGESGVHYGYVAVGRKL